MKLKYEFEGMIKMEKNNEDKITPEIKRISKVLFGLKRGKYSLCILYTCINCDNRNTIALKHIASANPDSEDKHFIIQCPTCHNQSGYIFLEKWK